MLINLILIACGFALLIGGANALVDGACSIARRLGLPDRVTGLTVVAVGTAAPELVVGITSALEGHADMAFGNVAGSCLANLLLILGLSATITRSGGAPSASRSPPRWPPSAPWRCSPIRTASLRRQRARCCSSASPPLWLTPCSWG